jgi:hypothetical protein
LFLPPELPVGCSNFECFLNEFDLLNETINAYINRKDNELAIFLVGMEKLPFEAIDKKLKEELVDFESIHKDYKIIISLNY